MSAGIRALSTPDPADSTDHAAVFAQPARSASGPAERTEHSAWLGKLLRMVPDGLRRITRYHTLSPTGRTLPDLKALTCDFVTEMDRLDADGPALRPVPGGTVTAQGQWSPPRAAGLAVRGRIQRRRKHGPLRGGMGAPADGPGISPVQPPLQRASKPGATALTTPPWPGSPGPSPRSTPALPAARWRIVTGHLTRPRHRWKSVSPGPAPSWIGTPASTVPTSIVCPGRSTAKPRRV